jgi:hypothetical protein
MNQFVFDPGQGFNAFAAGANIGSGIRQAQTNSKLAPMVAKGDYQGAANYAAERGDLPSAELYRSQYMEALKAKTAEEQAAELQRTQGIANIAMGGLSLPDEQLGAYVQQNAQQLQSLGIQPDQIAQWSQPGALTNAQLKQFVYDAMEFNKAAEMALKGPEYTNVQNADGTNSAFNKSTGEYGAPNGPTTPEAPTKYSFEQIGEDIFAIDPTNPENKMRVGPAPAKAPLVQNTVNSGSGMPELSPLEKKMDEHYADALVNWNTGGQSDWQKNQTQINNIADVLESGGKNLTGYLIGITPKWALEGINPEAVDAQEQVEEVVQRNLRIVLGAQFTQKEGERLIARAYNRRLKPEMNAARVRRLAQLLEGRAQQLQSLNEYVRQNRTAAGWNGTLTSVDQMLDDLDQISGGSNSPGTPTRDELISKYLDD